MDLAPPFCIIQLPELCTESSFVYILQVSGCVLVKSEWNMKSHTQHTFVAGPIALTYVSSLHQFSNNRRNVIRSLLVSYSSSLFVLSSLSVSSVLQLAFWTLLSPVLSCLVLSCLVFITFLP
jgi:hypothetical protein